MELFWGVCKPAATRQVVVDGLDDTWGIDLVDMQNRDYKGAGRPSRKAAMDAVEKMKPKKRTKESGCREGRQRMGETE